MIRHLLSCLFCLWAAGAAAQSVAVRSGEHSDFTRVVLQFDQRPDWAAGRLRTGYGVRLDRPLTGRVDLSRAFTLITRDRVRNIRALPEIGQIAIDLACVCWAEITEYTDTILVIDVRDGSAPPDAPFQDRLTWTSNAPLAGLENTLPIEFFAPSTGVLPRVPLPEMAPEPPRLGSTLFAATLDAALFSIPDKHVPMGIERAGQRAVREPDATLSVIATEVSRAVAQGLLDQNAEPPQGPPRRTAERRTIPNLTVDTAIDQALGRVFGEVAAPVSTNGCIPQDRIDVASWGHPDGVDGLGVLRRRAIAEDGGLTQSGLLDLARAYIHLGFGAEARAAARQLTSLADKEVILALADIVDHGASDAAVLENQFACVPAAGVWRALARPFEANDLPRDLDPILAVFSAFPLHHRIHLGPILAERLRLAGFPAESRLALNTAVRSGNESIRQELTSARLELTGTRAEFARERLVNLAQGTGLEAAEALLELLDDARRRETAPNAAWVDDAPSLVRATRGTPVSQALFVASLRGGIALNRFEAVRMKLSQSRNELSANAYRDLMQELVIAGALRADDGAFLKAELMFESGAGLDDLPAAARSNIGERLLTLGLADRALPYFAGDAPKGLRARALSDLGDHRSALDLLGDATSEDDLWLRARILSESGASLAAARVYFDLNDTERGRREAIRAGDWALAALSPADQSIESDAEEPTAAKGRNTRLLEVVAGQRRALNTLLDETRID